MVTPNTPLSLQEEMYLLHTVNITHIVYAWACSFNCKDCNCISLWGMDLVEGVNPAQAKESSELRGEQKTLATESSRTAIPTTDGCLLWNAARRVSAKLHHLAALIEQRGINVDGISQ